MFEMPLYKSRSLGKGSEKQIGKKYGLLPNQGGSPGVVKNHTAFLKKCIFQRVSRIILGPPKHVLHLVWSVLGIYTAIITALKVAFYDFFDGPPAPLTQGQAFPSFV